MAQADGKYGNLRVVKLPDLPDDGSTFLRIPGPVAQHDAVRIQRDDLFRGSESRIDRHLAAPLRQGAGDIGLCPEIQQRHPQASAVQLLHQRRLALPDSSDISHSVKPDSAGQRPVLFQRQSRLHHILLPAGHLLHHLARGVCLQPGEQRLKIVVFVRSDHAVHGALLPQNLGQGPGIDSGNAGYIIFFEELLET